MYEAPPAVISAAPSSGDTSRVILHFDYDCFYCSVFEAHEPTLRTVPFAVQQKHIIVTCNYEARRRGLYKLQLVTDAKRACPDLVIRLGEDLDPFRAASKRCFQHLASLIWSGRAERLGFDEVWLDVGDMVDFNMPLMKGKDSFFRLDPADESSGFAYDATTYAGYTYPENEKPRAPINGDVDPFTASTREAEARLVLGSHLARHLRHQLEEQLHFTATVGISVNKVLSKLVGNCHKPNGQTTLAPPYFASSAGGSDHVQAFMDGHDIGRVPGIGFKSAQALRGALLGRTAEISGGLVYGYTKEDVRVSDVRKGLSPESLNRILGGPGAARDVGQRTWALLHGIDDGVIAPASTIPTQISLEDSYLRLDGWSEIRAQMVHLSGRLIRRMRLELYDNSWIAHAQTLRLTTRPRPMRAADGSRPRSSKRISRSAPMPTFVLSLNQEVSALAERLVAGYVIPMFRALHPRTAGLDLSLINVAATHIVAVEGRAKDQGTLGRGRGRDIGEMFRAVRGPFMGHDVDTDAGEGSHREMEGVTDAGYTLRGSEDVMPDDAWDDENEEYHDDDDPEDLQSQYQHQCAVCGAYMPPFAWEAHARFHEQEDGSVDER